MAVWLYPVSRAGGYEFEDARGRMRPTTHLDIASAVAEGAFPRAASWPCVQNAGNVEPGDMLYLYTGEGDIGIFAAGTITGAERDEDGGWWLDWELDAARTKALLADPVPAAKVREHVHPRVTIRDFSEGSRVLRKLLPG
jgi:hypothetical protein